MCGRVVIAATAILLLMAGAAWAQSDQEKEARRLFVEGNRKVDSGDLQGAVGSYQAAYDLAPSRPKILLNIGAVLADLKRYADQANIYQAYLDHPKRDGGKAKKLKAGLAKLDRRVGRLRLIIGPGGKVSIDGKPIAEGPLIKLHRVTVGSHAIIARFASGTVAKEVIASAGAEETLELKAPPKNAPDKPTGDPPPDNNPATPDPVASPEGSTGTPFYKRVWIYTLAAGVGAAGVGVYFGLQAKSAEEDYDALIATPGVEYVDAKEIEDRGKRDATIANIALISAGAFAVTSAVLMYFDFTGGEDEGDDLAIVPVRGGGAMMVRGWRF